MNSIHFFLPLPGRKLVEREVGFFAFPFCPPSLHKDERRDDGEREGVRVGNTTEGVAWTLPLLPFFFIFQINISQNFI